MNQPRIPLDKCIRDLETVSTGLRCNRRWKPSEVAFLYPSLEAIGEWLRWLQERAQAEKDRMNEGRE